MLRESNFKTWKERLCLVVVKTNVLWGRLLDIELRIIVL